jgi:hypothetical protein
MIVKASYSLKVSDLIKHGVYHHFHTLKVHLVFLAVTLLYSAVINISRWDLGRFLLTLPFIYLAMEVAILLVIAIRPLIIKSFKVNEAVFAKRTITINDREIIIKNKKAEGKADLIDLWQARESKNYFFLYLNASQAHIIPKKALTNQEEVQNLRLILKENKLLKV